MDIKEMSSWGISQAIYEVIENGFYADEETGEIYFTSDDLEKLNDALDIKLNSICGYIKQTEAKIDSLKKRKTDIEANIKFFENREEKLSEFLKKFMESHDIEKKELADYRLGTRKSSSVSVTDEDAVYQFLKQHPDYMQNCQKTEVKTSLVKTELKKVLANENIPGAMIVENKNIVIK